MPKKKCVVCGKSIPVRVGKYCGLCAAKKSGQYQKDSQPREPYRVLVERANGKWEWESR